MRNAEDIFYRSKRESIDIVENVTFSYVVNPSSKYKDNTYELGLISEFADNGGALLSLQEDEIKKALNKQRAKHELGKIYLQAPTCPITCCKGNADKVYIRARTRCLYRGEAVNVPIYDVHEAPGQDIRAARRGKEIKNGTKVRAEVLFEPYVIAPNNKQFLTVDGVKREVNYVGVTLKLLSVTIISEPKA